MNICDECKHCVADIVCKCGNGEFEHAFVCDEGMGNFMTPEGCWRWERKECE